MKKLVITAAVLAAFVAAFAVLGGCGNSAAADTEAPGELDPLKDAAIYSASDPTVLAALPDSYSVRALGVNKNWEGDVGNSLPVGTVASGSLSIDLPDTVTEELGDIFDQMYVGSVLIGIFDPVGQLVYAAEQFQVGNSIPAGIISYKNTSPAAQAVFLYSSASFVVSASVPDINMDFDFEAAPGWNILWSKNGTITNNPPSPLNAKWVFEVPE